MMPMAFTPTLRPKLTLVIANLESSHPDIVLSEFQVTSEHIHGLPASCAHDRRGVEAGTQEVLRCAYAQGVAAKRRDLFW